MRVTARLGEAELENLRACVDRGRPLGSKPWVAETARRLGLDFTLRELGRPRKQKHRDVPFSCAVMSHSQSRRDHSPDSRLAAGGGLGCRLVARCLGLSRWQGTANQFFGWFVLPWGGGLGRFDRQGKRTQQSGKQTSRRNEFHVSRPFVKYGGYRFACL